MRDPAYGRFLLFCVLLLPIPSDQRTGIVQGILPALPRSGRFRGTVNIPLGKSDRREWHASWSIQEVAGIVGDGRAERLDPVLGWPRMLVVWVACCRYGEWKNEEG